MSSPPPIPDFNLLSLPNSSAPTTPPLRSNVPFLIAMPLLGLLFLCSILAVFRFMWILHFNPQVARALGWDKSLDEELLRSLPKLTFSSSSNPDQLSDCPICLANFADGEEIRILPRCSHAFHLECIDIWFSNRSTCPTCRQNLAVQPAEPAAADVETGAQEGDRAGATP